MNLKKKNHRLLWAAFFGIVLFAGGCVPELEELPISGDAVLLFRVLNEGGMSIPLDPENDPIYSRVEVSGTGPGEGDFVTASIGPECTLTDLRAGEWQIEGKGGDI